MKSNCSWETADSSAEFAVDCNKIHFTAGCSFIKSWDSSAPKPFQDLTYAAAAAAAVS